MDRQSFIFRKRFQNRKIIISLAINFAWVALLVAWSVWPIGGFFLAANWGFTVFGYELGKNEPGWLLSMPVDVYNLLWAIYWISSNALFLLLISSLPRLKQKLGIGDSKTDHKILLNNLHLSKPELKKELD
jgi:hypothetical protein